MGREINEAQHTWLAGELAAWCERGIVTAPQAEAVLGLYGTTEDFRQRRQSKAMLTLLSLAVLLVGLGVLLLIGYNWEEMPAAAKVIAVFASVVAAHGVGITLRSKPGLRGGSEAAFFFGCLLYGAGIWLLAQVFHVRAHDPDGFWWWAVGVLPFALALDTLLMHTLLVGLLAVWAGYEVIGFGSAGAWFFGRFPALPNGAYSLPFLAAPGLRWAYRKESARAVALYVPLIAWWVILQPIAWRFGANPVYFVGTVGALLLLAAEAHRVASPMAIPYRFYGAVLIAGSLIPLSYQETNHAVGRPEQVFLGLLQTLAIVGLAVVVLAGVVVVRRRSRPAPVPVAEEALELARRQWLPCGLIALMAGLGLWSAVDGEALVATLLANAAMVVFSLWLMHVGLREDRGVPFAAGVAYFLLWAVLRYIDLFGVFGGMLGAASVFFLCGATLFGVAYFWRRRKEVLHA